MLIALLAFFGGVLTILSPCILPVLPFVFARAERPFLRNGLPLLAGMTLTFAGIATLAAVGGAWAVRINQYGRFLALALLVGFAATLLSRRLATWVARPFVALGNRLLPPASGTAASDGLVSSLALGVATGLLWAPCAGPILGLVLTGAAVSGPTSQTTVLLFAYAAGAATSLSLATLAGGRIFAALKRSLGAGEWIRRGLGVAVLLAVVAIASGWDSGILTRLSLGRTDRLEQRLVDIIRPSPAAATMTVRSGPLPIEGELPSLDGATGWLNSPPLTAAGLRGKVVLVDFWTYSCINCLRALPYVEQWYARYKDHGLVVIGVHSPEFAFEKDSANVRRAVAQLGVAYPVALDNRFAIWQGFNNNYWPAHYFIDTAGHIRAHHFGEGSYAESEQTIRGLLQDAGYRDLPAVGSATGPAASGVQAAAGAQVQSPETYVGYGRAERFVSPEGAARDRAAGYTAPPALALNQWALTGRWTVEPERAVLASAPGTISFRFLARDLHLVLGAGAAGRRIRFRVRLDGAAPGANHGMDVDADGNGVVDGQRLYQLIRQTGAVGEHTFTIEFLDGGVQAYAFTFG